MSDSRSAAKATDGEANIEGLLHRARDGDRRALARLISTLERSEGRLAAPIHQAGMTEEDLCIGITGAPGAGKSTLVNALTETLLDDEERAAILAVDPSSPLSRGALLGDRVRMHSHATADNVFIRSMATRGQQGGLAGATQSTRRLLQYCGWPLVLIETVGVGQVELDIVNTADIAVVVLNPGWGDEIQANKAGLMEIADIFVINKADRPGVEETRRDIDAVRMTREEKDRPAVVETVASTGQGMDALWQALRARRRTLLDSAELDTRRQRQLAAELHQQLRSQLTHALQEYAAGSAIADDIAALRRGDRAMEAVAQDALRGLLEQSVARVGA